VAARLRPEALGQDIARRREHLTRTTARLRPAIARNLEAHRKHLDASARMLESLSHKSVLARGFVMVHRDDGVLVRAAKDLNAGDVVQLTFGDGDKHAVIATQDEPAAQTSAQRRR